jgi:serine/tyrosine/threonine adenylyltransferase
LKLNVNNTFINELPADVETKNISRQVPNACFSFVNPIQPKKPELIAASKKVAFLLGLTENDLASKHFLDIFSGTKILDNTQPFAMNYGGHQFGHWAGQLGDGRAINLFEVEHNKLRLILQLKGAGRTPYSRSADGLAVLRSSIREYLCSEAMHHLGVPTTRALSIIKTGDDVLRDVMYNGNPAYEKGAIVCRVAPTFIRFGSFQIHTSRDEINTLKQLTDYTIRHFFPHLGEPSKQTYIAFFSEVSKRTLEMIIHWQRVGFVHGVMNTDNLSVLGLTIDYGPYGWMDDYNPEWTPNTTDAQHRRYRFGNQPEIARWNLLQLANALFPLVNDSEPFVEILKQFAIDFDAEYLNMMLQKLGLFTEQDEDNLLIIDLESALQLTEADMTIFFRTLSDIDKNSSAEENLQLLNNAFYRPEAINEKIKATWLSWLEKYAQRLNVENNFDAQRKQKMNSTNPKYVLRNYMAQLAIDKADEGDYSLIYELENLLKKPYDEQPDMQQWFAKRPDWAKNKIGCSQLSCSS